MYSVGTRNPINSFKELISGFKDRIRWALALGNHETIRNVLDIKGLDTVYSQFYELEKTVCESYACEKKQTRISDFFQIKCLNFKKKFK